MLMQMLTILGVVGTVLGICLGIPRTRHFILRNFRFLNRHQLEKIIKCPSMEEIEKYGKSFNLKMLILLPLLIFLILFFYLYSKGIFKK